MLFIIVGLWKILETYFMKELSLLGISYTKQFEESWLPNIHWWQVTQASSILSVTPDFSLFFFFLSPYPSFRYSYIKCPLKYHGNKIFFFFLG